MQEHVNKIFITGIAGFIGFHLANRLLEKNIEVIGCDNVNPYYDISLKYNRLYILRKKITFLKCDIKNKESIEFIFEQYKPNIVINLAAQAGVRYSINHPGDYIDSNLIGFYNILESCRRYKVEHLIFASSSSVYGNQKSTPFSVRDNVDKPISLYAATKKSNELMAFAYSHLYDIPTTGLRFFTVYGPYGRPDMAYFSFANKIMEGQPIKVFNNGDMLRDFTYIDDIVEGIDRILFNPPKRDINGDRYKLYNIGNNRPEKLLYFIELLEKELGRIAQKEYLPMQPGDVYQTFADISELENDFNFRPQIPIEEGLKRFAKWYKDYYFNRNNER